MLQWNNDNMNISLSSFISAGYSMPFEGERHEATIVELPYRTDVWREHAEHAMLSFLSVSLSIAKYEKVYLLTSKEAFELLRKFQDSPLVKEVMSNKAIELVPMAYDDSWARDNTPVFVRSKNGQVVGVNYGFNAWGGEYNGLYDSWEQDNALGEKLLSFTNIPELDKKDFILEGGSIHTNGKATLLTTEECLLSKGRNPSLTKVQIEETLKTTLGQKKVIWLPYGVYNDETSGHVDNMACFLDDNHVLLASTDIKDDPMYERYKRDLEVLKNETTADGKNIEVIEMPIPGPLYTTSGEDISKADDGHAKIRKKGDRLAGSYVNFYMGEKFIILPSFNDPKDEIAKSILNNFYKGSKEVITIPGREILLGGGNIHCITKQIPVSSK